jgi:protein tyrosine/serine phosphatase
MLRKFANWVHLKERALHHTHGNDITDPVARQKSWRHYLWLDHGVLRYWWKNFAKVTDGVYRSNHPHHTRLAGFKDAGVTTILNLRGAFEKAPYLFEVESCAQLDLTLVSVPLGAREFPYREKLLMLLDAMDIVEKPVVMHCKSGADRTGLAAAMYLLRDKDADLDAVRAQLSFKFLHIRKSDTGRLDYFLDRYIADRIKTEIALRDWIETMYDRDAMIAAYDSAKAAETFWQGWR